MSFKAIIDQFKVNKISKGRKKNAKFKLNK